MGVDASYLYGYGIKVDEIEWDIEYLKVNYIDKLNERILPNKEWSITWGDFIEDLTEALSEENHHLVVETLEYIDELLELNYDNKYYITFTHNHIVKLFPEVKVKDMDLYAKLYAKELGIKNIDDIEWIEWGYFS